MVRSPEAGGALRSGAGGDFPDTLSYGLSGDFASQVMDELERQGITLAELARRMGIKQPTLCGMLRGTSNMTLKTMARMALALGCTLEAPRLDNRRRACLAFVVGEGRAVRCARRRSQTASRGRGAAGVSRLLQTAWRGSGFRGTLVRFAILLPWTNYIESAFEGDMIEEESGWGGFADDGLGPADAGGVGAPWVRLRFRERRRYRTRFPRTPSASNAKAVAGLRSSAPCASMGASPLRPSRSGPSSSASSASSTACPRCRACTSGRTSPARSYYVGKAKQLRARMRQYVNCQDERAKIPLLVDQIDSFDYLVVENEHESLVLEKNLINQHAPFFNADFKDDKTYPFIALTKGDVFPAIKYTREKHKRRHEVLRPLHRQPRRPRHGGHRPPRRAAVRHVVRRLAPAQASRSDEDPLAACSEPRGAAVLRRARGPRPRRVLRRHHARGVPASTSSASSASSSGQHREFVDRAHRGDAGRRRRARLRARRAHQGAHRHDQFSLTDKQHAVSTRNLNADVVGLFREETVAGVHVFMVREGRIVNSNEFVLDRGKDVPDQDLLHMFLLRYYDATTSIPHEVILRDEPEDKDAMEAWLTEKLASPHGAKVRICAPQKGEKAELAGHGRDEREAHAHALQGTHELRRQAHQQRAPAAGERARPRRAADAHRVLRHLHHPRLLHGGLDGGVHQRQARQESVPPLQDQDAARRGE